MKKDLVYTIAGTIEFADGSKEEFTKDEFYTHIEHIQDAEDYVIKMLYPNVKKIEAYIVSFVVTDLDEFYHYTYGRASKLINDDSIVINYDDPDLIFTNENERNNNS